MARDAAGNVVFTAAKGFSGTASFQYVESDGHGGSSTAKVTLNVLPAKDPHLIIGTPGNDTLSGTTGNDVFYGKGGADTFVFRGVTGNDRIADFEIGNYFQGAKDVLDLRGHGITRYDLLWNMIDQVGADTVITLDNHSSIRLTGVQATHLMLDNFKII